MSEVKSGFSIHCNHDILAAHCYDYDERIRYIKKTKPKNEQEIRLRLFKLLPQEAIDEIPKEFVEASVEYGKAEKKLAKALGESSKRSPDYGKAERDFKEACNKWRYAYHDFSEAYAKWLPSTRKDWHTKWCGCKEWQNGRINFE